MKDLYLVGKALPEDKKFPPFPSGGLSDLVDLDPRHGVFPNLVMTPLFATVMTFYCDGDTENVIKLLDQAKELLHDRSDRRFNVLDKPAGMKHKLASNIPSRLQRLDPARELLLVFKHSTAYGLITFLLKGKTEFTEGDLNSYGDEFLRRCTEAPGCKFELPGYKNTQVGLLFRLCTDDDVDGNGATSYLRHAIREMAPNRDIDRIVAVLRSFVPLLHNDAYDKTPIGLIQARFMAVTDLPTRWTNDHEPSPDLYWRFIGKAIRRRLLSQT